MVRKIIIALAAILLLAPVSPVSGQDPHFSQFYANPLYLNPAFAGTVVCPRLIMNYRNQWPSISGTYVTYNASYDQHFDAISGGVGLLVNTDRAGEGTLTTNTISGIYSYRLTVNRFFSIKAGFQATYFQKSLDWQKLTFGDQIDPKHGFVFNTNEKQPELTKNSTDFAVGLLGYSENIFGGVAVHHLTEPDEGFISYSKLPMKLTVHTGGVIDLSKRGRRSRRRKVEDPTLSPNLLYMQQQNFQQMNYGMYFNRYPFVGGLWFRQNFQNPDALIILAGFQQSTFKFGYSYDITVSKLSNASGGAHEFSFAIQFDCKPARKRIRAINCPSF